MLKDFDRSFKIIIVGDAGVGKSSLLLRYVDNIWSTSTLSTIGVDLKFKAIAVNGQKVKIQIWDTAGSQTFRSIVSAYYRGADAVVFVYDASNRNSFLQLQNFWIKEVKQYKQPNCQLVLLANKSDLITQESFDEEVRNFIEKQKFIIHKHTSAKTGTGISQVFQELAQYLVKTRPITKQQLAKNQKSIMKIDINDNSQVRVLQNKRCCK